ncbi:MAG: 4-(cytidine 5'-diphospho)-2-C-methyl-D-erythritol kinase [Bauldia sp.]
MTRAAGDAVEERAPDPATREAARAKLNLALHVLGRRSDGFHDLESLVVFADAGDVLTVEEGTPRLEIDGPFAHQLAAEPSEGNLVARVAAHFTVVAGVERGDLRVRLQKNLPVGAGLGGGSADAAAMLRILAGRAEVPVPGDVLHEVAGELGADVPMCLVSEPLLAGGKGERLRTVPGIPALHVVLVWPAVSVSTAMVFRRLFGPRDPELPTLPAAFASVAEFVRWLRQTRNGLEDTARDCAPAIGHALQALIASPGCMFARMSGSGSTVFGIFPFRDAAEHAARLIRSAEPDWWAIATTTGGS